MRGGHKTSRIGRFVQFARRHGFGGAAIYFLNTTWFDLRTGLDTARSVGLESLGLGTGLVGDGVEYLPSWTVTVRRALRAVKETLGSSALEHPFFDVGAGKGKVCIVWAQEVAKLSISRPLIFAVEISKSLCGIASNNVSRAGLSREVSIVERDAVDLRVDQAQPVILWLYNPFGESTLTALLENIRGRVLAIVYCNPVAHDTVVAGGYAVKYQEKRWHPNLSFTLYVPLLEPSRH